MSLSVAFALALQAVTVVPPVADVGQKAIRLQCSDENFSQVDYRTCLQRKAADSDRELRAATARVLARLGQWDEDPPYVAKARAALAQSTPAFVEYRRRQCAFASSMSGGAIGAASEGWRLACVYELTMRRAAMLDGLVRDLPRK